MKKLILLSILTSAINLYADTIDGFSKTITRIDNPSVFKKINSIFGESAEYLVDSDKADYYYSMEAGDLIVGYYDLSIISTEGWEVGASDPCDADGASADCESPWWSGRWSSGELLESEVKNLFKWYGGNLLSSGGKTVACMDSNPLRYGDIEGDGKSELVLILNNNWLIFNPDLKKVTFLYLLNVADWYLVEDTEAQIGNASKHPDNPQYVSAMASDASYPSKIDSTVVEPGHRGYGKLFVGHFESAESNDILEWRKLYKSRLNKDPIKGFEKISDTFAHYKLINGEYQKQTTPEATIKSWLAAKQLTWQKGYPSKSECPGQEGRLIPEMHDPLLNDPDVLH